jgi:hypothetical protein
MIDARSFVFAAALAAGALALGPRAVLAQPAQPAAAAAQTTFASPEAAGQALVEALGAEDAAVFSKLFGPRIEEIRGGVDPIEWRENRNELAAAAKESLTVRRDGDARAVLVLGSKVWPFPIPLVAEGGAWRFDTDAGIEEILDRRIGEHELAAVELLRAYVDAQVEYASEDRDGDQVNEYAQSLLSPAGTKGGLYWPTTDGEDPSPFGEFVARASAAPYVGKAKLGDPYRGYFFHVLTKQGAAVPGGAYDYVINGNMIAGFALVAFPAEYGKSGIMTFVVSHQGKVYEKDLGATTSATAGAMKVYNPDSTWHEVTDDATAAEGGE